MVNIEQQILAEFTDTVKAVFLPPIFLGFDRNGFMQTKNYFIDVARLDSNDLRTGATLWRKYKEIRLILMNDFAPILSAKLPGGMPPSCGRIGYIGPTGRTGPSPDPSDPTAYCTHTSLALLLAS